MFNHRHELVGCAECIDDSELIVCAVFNLLHEVVNRAEFIDGAHLIGEEEFNCSYELIDRAWFIHGAGLVVLCLINARSLLNMLKLLMVLG
jgi:hypothetical protein